jgi:hypothetical protein
MFPDPESAAIRYNEEAVKIHGASAVLNVLPETIPGINPGNYFIPTFKVCLRMHVPHYIIYVHVIPAQMHVAAV